MLTLEKLRRKQIFPDDETLKNLRNIKSARKSLGLTLKALSGRTGINLYLLSDYENQRCRPTLGKYIKLADFFGWDISKSINYRFWHQFLSLHHERELKKKKLRFNLSNNEIANLLGVKCDMVRNTLNRGYKGSANIFAGILAIYDDEQRREFLIRELTR